MILLNNEREIKLLFGDSNLFDATLQVFCVEIKRICRKNSMNDYKLGNHIKTSG